ADLHIALHAFGGQQVIRATLCRLRFLVHGCLPLLSCRERADEGCDLTHSGAVCMRSVSYPLAHTLDDLGHHVLIRGAAGQGAEDGGAVATGLEPAVEKDDGVAPPGAPGEAAKRMTQSERSMWYDELGLGIAPGLGARRKQRIAQRWEGDARH